MKILFSIFIFGAIISCTSNNAKLNPVLAKTKNNLDKISYEISLSQPKYPIKKISSDTAAWHVRHFERRKLEGDFNGDGTTEILYESVFSRTTGKKIDSIVFQRYDEGGYYHYDEEVDAMQHLNPVLKLKCQEKINELKLNNHWQVFGILQMINLGNVNENPGDEIALIVNWADWSSINSCQIYSYCNEKWQEVFWFEIHERGLDYHPRKSHEITNALEYKKGQWYYLDEDFIDGGEKWRKLNSCFCGDD